MPSAQPKNPGRNLRGRSDRYLVRWNEGGYLHVRYFREETDATAMLEYVKQFDPSAYAASVA